MAALNDLVIPDASLLTAKQEEIDESIDDNLFEIQECLENIQSLLKGLPLPEGVNSAPDLETQLTCVSNYLCIEKSACYDFDIEELQHFFSKLNNFLAKNPGKEEGVFSLLLKLCSHTGFTLLWKNASHEGQAASMLSLNVFNEEDEQMCEALWDELKKTLEDSVITSLYQLPTTDESAVVRQSRAAYIERLHLLISTRELSQQYRSLRGCSFSHLINDQLSSEGASPTFARIVNAFEKIIGHVMTMIDGDFHLLVSGIFRKVATTFEMIKSIYFDKLTDEIESVLDDLATDIYGQVDAKVITRRQSDFALAGKLKEKMTKSKSKASMERGDSFAATIADSDLQTLLNSDTMASLIRLCRALRSLDEHVHSLYLMSYTEQRGTSSHTLASAESLRGVLKSTSVTDISILSDSLTSDTSELQSILHSGRLHHHSSDKPPQVVDRPMHHDKPQLLWQPSFTRFISDMSLFVEAHINAAADTCVTTLTSSDPSATMKLCSRCRGSKMEYPVTVWKVVSDLVLAMEFVFPLAQAGDTLLPVRQAFIATTMSASKALLETIQKVVDSREETGESNKVILVAASSIALLRNTLYQCDTTLHKDNQKHNTFVLVYHQACQAVDSLAQQYVTLQADFVHNSLLQDADSFNWSHHQEFYESERCSFPVQTWSYYMQSMRQELWDICPPTNAVAIFSDLFKQTLESLTLRYLNEFPTYRRMDQFRLDIGVILYTTYELMFHISSSSGQLLNLESVAHSQPYLTIHSCCCKLLAVLAVTTSSLTDLYKVYKKGYQRKSKRRRQNTEFEEETGYYSYWLAWLQPNVIPRNITRLCDMQTTTALYLQIKLMLAQPELQWHNLIQVITMKDFTLPIMMLTQGSLDVRPLEKPTCAAPADLSHPQPAFETTDSKCHLAFCDGSCDLHNIDHLFEPFIMVLQHCNKPSALYNVLLPVIERGVQWRLLNSDEFYQNMKTKMPQWMQVLISIIADKMDAVISAVITKVSQSLSQPNVMDIRDYMQSFPCGCMLDEELSLEEEVSYSNMIVREVLTALPAAASRLSISICLALQGLGSHLQDQTSYVSDVSDCFILQTLGFALCDCLSSQKHLESINEGTIPIDVLTCLQASAECVYAALSTGADVTNLQLSKQHMQCLTENHHWISEQREEIVRNIKNRESLWPDLDVDGSTAESFAEFATTDIVAEILETTKGETYLRQIHHLISNNQNWIYFSLDIHEYLDQNLPMEPQAFIPDILDHSDERAKARRNPLTLYNQIGNFKIDFDLIRQRTEDVAGLLQCDLGITDLSFTCLLQHRPDFQDETQLDPNEKRHVKLLKGKFHIASGEETL